MEGDNFGYNLRWQGSKMKCTIKNNILLCGDTKFEIGDLFSDKTIKYANENADIYYSKTCLVNELYDTYVLPYYNISEFLKRKGIDVVDVNKADSDLIALISSCAKNGLVKIIGNRKVKIKFKTGCTKIGAFLYLLIHQIGQPRREKKKESEAIAFIRSKAAKSKFSKFEDIDKLYENTPGVGSIYSQLPLFKRIKLLFKAIGLSKQYENELKNALTSYGLETCIPIALFYYAKRMIHTGFYYLVENEIISNSTYRILYTGNNLDRFAINEENIAKNNNLELRVVPHGIEYGYRFPKEFIGDIFYTCSKNAADYLNALYKTNKYYYSEKISKRMFDLGLSPQKTAKVIYYSEPREHMVNIQIVKNLAPILTEHNIPLFIKLHPADTLENYECLFDMGIKEIREFDSAICGNICVSRKSTVLLEAIYNQSKAIAILVNDKDRCIFRSFPSLQDKMIISVEQINEAALTIIDLYNTLNVQ